MKTSTSLTRSRRNVLPVIAGMALLGLASPARAELISLDFGPVANSSGFAPATPFSGVEPVAAAANAAFAAANQWNHPTFAHYSQSPQVDAFFPGLVNSTGAVTGVSLAMYGTLESFAQNNPSPDDLRNDYIYFNTPNNPETEVDWVISGLAPSTQYVMFSYSHWTSDREFLMLVDANGDGSLGDESSFTVISAGTLSPVITSSAGGQIVGRSFGNGPSNDFANEADWSGFQLATVDAPIPVKASTWSRIKSQY